VGAASRLNDASQYAASRSSLSASTRCSSANFLIAAIFEITWSMGDPAMPHHLPAFALPAWVSPP
jgi:hypothetical protein